MTDTPKTLIEAVTYYSDPKVCFETMLGVKWPDGKITCPKCGGTKIGVIRTRQMLRCNDQQKCGKQFSVKVGTIFEDSPLPLWKWLVAAWAVANSKNGISSLELGRALGVTQKTAWFMGHRIRLAMRLSSASASPTASSLPKRTRASWDFDNGQKTGRPRGNGSTAAQASASAEGPARRRSSQGEKTSSEAQKVIKSFISEPSK